jgi:hypothetical protein
MTIPSDTQVTGTVAQANTGDLTDEQRAELIRKAKAYDEIQAQSESSAKQKASFYLVKVSNPVNNGRIVFRSVSEKRAMAWVVAHCPRGSEFYLEAPDGTITSYEQERTGEKGADVEQWAPYDPSEYVSPELNQTANQSDPWSDSEG